MYRGWYQLAYERDLKDDLTPVTLGERQLVLVRGAVGIRAVDAFCPHRGAHLGYGGRLEDNAIICPFHEYRIGMGQPSPSGFCVQPYRTLVIGGLVFVSLGDDHDSGFEAFMTELDKTHFFVPGFAMRLQAPATMVIENAFDNTHFRPVHGICNDPRFEVLPGHHGELAVSGTFALPPSPWQKTQSSDGPIAVPFVARAFSPGIVVSELGGTHPYRVITTSTPVNDHECIVRLSLAMPPGEGGAPPNDQACLYLLRQSKAGIEQDQVIWEHMSSTAPSRFTPEDKSVIEFRKFCKRFREAA